MSGDAVLHSFLTAAGWQTAERHKLAGDASTRAYERLTLGDKKAILMQDPASDVAQNFVRITGQLHGMGYSAPRILADQSIDGLVLLEDLGDSLFARLLEQNGDEEALYTLAVNFLIDIRKQPLPNKLPFFSGNYVLNQNAVFLDWYVSRGLNRNVPQKARLFFQQVWRVLLKHLENAEEVLLYRDYHAENILHLPDRSGLQALGLLDYQDAMTGPAAYDLVSLLQDARRDVSPSVAEKMIAKYIYETGVDATGFRRQYAILGAHRALRILGIFTRLRDQDGKTRYEAFMPRMKQHLRTNLAHPDLLALRHWLKVTLGEFG
jgi:N-acetylmuramate 1-kinase